MASEAQVVANRLNAQKSTGPRTPEGKAVVAQNAVKHGLRAEQAVIVGEDPGEFESYRDLMLGELAPAGAVESMLAERIVSLAWRLRRAERLQNEAFDALYLKETAGPVAKLTQSLHPKPPEGYRGDGDPALGRVVLHGFSHDRVLDRLMMYERRIEQSLYKTMAELQRVRVLRELDGPAEEPACGVPVREVARASRPWKDKQGQDGLATKTAPGVSTDAPPAGASPPAEVPHHCTAGPAQPGAEDLSCQTKPISGDERAYGDPKRDVSRLGTHAGVSMASGGPENLAGRETGADSAKQSQFAQPAGRQPALDGAEESQVDRIERLDE